MSIQTNFPAIKPTLLLDFANTEQLDPRITFTRASTATFYNGVTTAKAEENLLTRSQEFNLWTLSNVTVGTDTDTAPDGTTTAEALKEDSATATHRMQQPATLALAASTVYTMSVFVKQKTGSRFATIGFNSDGSNWASATFDLSAGTNTQTLSAGFTSVSATITASVSSWYRVTLTATTNASAAASALALIGLSATSTFASSSRGFDSYAGNNTSEILYWGAQLEQRSAVSAYTPTTTQPITNYIPVLQTAASGVARFDHNPTTFESLGLLIEESRTNLLVRSEEFDNASWTKGDSSITANTVVAPSGALAGDKLVENTSNANHIAAQSFSFVGGTTYTLSVYAKAAERTSVRLSLPSAVTTDAIAAFNLATGVVSSTSTGVTSALVTSVGGGWFRCSITVTATNSATGNVTIWILNPSSPYTGDGYSGIYIWGAQLEAGAFATSYIPTVASQVTRAADAASMTGANFSSWYRADEGTLYGEVAPIASGSFGTLTSAEISNGNFDKRLFQSITGSVYRTYYQFPISSLNTSATASAGVFAKLATSYASTAVAMSVSGSASVTTSTVWLDSAAATTLRIGASFSIPGNNYVKKLAYYPARLTNAQLQALTS